MIDELKEMWKKDSAIDPTRVVDMVVGVPNLHSKYVELLSTARLKYRKIESDMYRLRRTKIRYYRGEMGKDELTHYGWAQWQGPKPLKTDLEELLSTDEDLLTKGDQLEYYRVAMEMLEMIMKSIHARGWDLKTIVEAMKFLQGG